MLLQRPPSANLRIAEQPQGRVFCRQPKAEWYSRK
jgi:hypothetical protein